MDYELCTGSTVLEQLPRRTRQAHHILQLVLRLGALKVHPTLERLAHNVGTFDVHRLACNAAAAAAVIADLQQIALLLAQAIQTRLQALHTCGAQAKTPEKRHAKAGLEKFKHQYATCNAFGCSAVACQRVTHQKDCCGQLWVAGTELAYGLLCRCQAVADNAMARRVELINRRHAQAGCRNGGAGLACATTPVGDTVSTATFSQH